MKPLEELMNQMKNGEYIPPIAKLLGFRLISCEDGESVFTMEASSKHHNPMGTLHGGVMVDIMDAAMGMAFASTLQRSESFTTINLQINYLKQVVEEKLTATAEVVKRGSSIGFLEAKLTNEDGELIATAQSTCKVIKID